MSILLAAFRVEYNYRDCHYEKEGKKKNQKPLNRIVNTEAPNHKVRAEENRDTGCHPSVESKRLGQAGSEHSLGEHQHPADSKHEEGKEWEVCHSDFPVRPTNSEFWICPAIKCPTGEFRTFNKTSKVAR